VLDVIESLFMTMFEGLKTRYAAELEAVQGQYPFTPIQAKPLRLTFPGGGSSLWLDAVGKYIFHVDGVRQPCC
jgi:hypothetical protein